MPPLTAVICATGPSDPLVQVLRPRNAPSYSMPLWRRGAGELTMPPLVHRHRAAKQSAATTVGARLVPALPLSKSRYPVSSTAAEHSHPTLLAPKWISRFLEQLRGTAGIAE